LRGEAAQRKGPARRPFFDSRSRSIANKFRQPRFAFDLADSTVVSTLVQTMRPDRLDVKRNRQPDQETIMNIQARPPRAPLNGVDTPRLINTINFVAGQPELAEFQFRAANEWIEGTHSRSSMLGFYGAGGEQKHVKAYFADGDHPNVLCGADRGPTPVEWLLHALATCLTAGIGNIAAARGVKLTKVRSFVEGDIDLRGILGLSDEVRNGYRNISIRFEIEGDAPQEKMQQILDQARARSAVFDVLTNGVPVSVAMNRIQ
jgi:uncharacterized OsmC-like protein